MRALAVALLTIAPLLCAAQEERKPKDGAEVTVREIVVERSTDRRILLDGSVSSSGGKPVAGGLTLIFDFLSSDGRTVMSRQSVIHKGDFGPGEEAEFHFQVPDEPRAVSLRLRAHDKGNRHVDVYNAGPFPVE